MPIFEHLRWGLAFGLALLVGCEPVTHPGEGAVTAVRVSGRAITVTGPSGYCVDPTSAGEKPSGAFVLLASCNALTPGGADAPGPPGILTALVTPPREASGDPSVAELEQFFRSRAGHAALSYDGRAESVSLIRLTPKGDALFLDVKDTSRTRPAELSETSWRAVFPLKGRIAALSVNGLKGTPMSDATSRTTLDRFARAMRRANP